MKSTLIKSFVGLILLAIGVFAYVFIPNHENLGKQTLSTGINDSFKLIGHQIHSTDPDAGKKFGYFILSVNDTVDDKEPFFVTSDPFLKVEQTGENTIKLQSSGRIYQYRNDLWIPQPSGQLYHWYVSLDSSYVR